MSISYFLQRKTSLAHDNFRSTHCPNLMTIVYELSMNPVSKSSSASSLKEASLILGLGPVHPAKSEVRLVALTLRSYSAQV